MRGWKSCHMWDLNARKQEKHVQTRRQKPGRLNNFMSNLFWQPHKPWTLADCLLVITEATSSAATGIPTLLSASWGWAQGVSVLRVGAPSCTTFLLGADGLKNTKPQTPTGVPMGSSPMHTSLRKELGIFSPCPVSGHPDSSIQQRGGRLCRALLHSCRWLMLEEPLWARFQFSQVHFNTLISTTFKRPA